MFGPSVEENENELPDNLFGPNVEENSPQNDKKRMMHESILIMQGKYDTENMTEVNVVDVDDDVFDEFI